VRAAIARTGCADAEVQAANKCRCMAECVRAEQVCRERVQQGRVEEWAGAGSKRACAWHGCQAASVHVWSVHGEVMCGVHRLEGMCGEGAHNMLEHMHRTVLHSVGRLDMHSKDMVQQWVHVCSVHSHTHAAC
jgi:hypothetical protein